MIRAILGCLLIAASNFGGATQAQAQPRSAKTQAPKRVMEVRYIGLSHITPRDLESSLPFSPGDNWTEAVTAKTANAIAAYYAKRGFYQAKVAVNTAPGNDDELLMIIKVTEGKPTRIRSLWIDDPPGFKSKSVMLRFKAKIASVVRVFPGDRYDEQVLADRLRELREWLMAEDYILANTDNIRVTYSADNSEADVVLAVDYGERVTFGFQGSTVFNKSELNDLINQVRSTGLGKDYVGVIQRRFIEEYLSRAYSNIKIEIKTSERPHSKHITFHFQEGRRTELEEIRWEGLSQANTKIAREVFDNGVSRLVQRGFFVDKDIDKGVLIVLEDLRSRGFLASKLVAKSVQSLRAPNGTQRMKVNIQLSDGEQTLVGRLELEGFDYFNNERVASILSLAEGQAFNPFMLEEGLQRLRSIYVGEGFLDFKFVSADEEVVRFSENNRTANISLKVAEGTRVRIGGIQIKGLQKTKEYVVSRELEVRPDDWWLASAIQDTETNLMTLGIFTEAKAVQQPSARGPGYRDMVIEVKEAEPGVLEAGPGFRSDLGARAFARVSYNNLLGRNWIGTLSGEGNHRIDNEYRFIEYKFDATFLEPRFFGSDVLYSIGISTRKQRFPPDFNAVTTTFSTGFERKFTKILSTRLSYKLERIRQFDVYFQDRLSAIDNRSMLIGSIVPTITIDTRDSPFTTSNGWLTTGSLEYAHPDLSGQGTGDSGAPGYQKWNLSIHRYTEIVKGIVWSKVVSGGFARSNIAGREIPLVKLFRLGGYSTIRGFSEDSINVDTVSILGTLTFLNLRTQFDLPLVGDLKFSPFLDAGNLYIDRVKGNPFFRAGAGVGLRYMTPVGPINLDWGHKINPVPGESPNQIHFSVGFI